jgi:hypothetical protein
VWIEGGRRFGDKRAAPNGRISKAVLVGTQDSICWHHILTDRSGFYVPIVRNLC